MSTTILSPLQGWMGRARPGGSGSDRGRQGLSGRHVLGILLAFFGAIFAMDGALIYWAIRTSSGLVANEPYRKGLHYNQRIAASERQAGLGWSEGLEVTRDGGMMLVLTDKAGRPVTGLVVEAVLGRPASNREDQRIALREAAPGRYQAQLAPLAAGSWLVALEARAGQRNAGTEEPIYRLRRRLWLTP